MAAVVEASVVVAGEGARAEGGRVATWAVEADRVASQAASAGAGPKVVVSLGVGMAEVVARGAGAARRWVCLVAVAWVLEMAGARATAMVADEKARAVVAAAVVAMAEVAAGGAGLAEGARVREAGVTDVAAAADQREALAVVARALVARGWVVVEERAQPLAGDRSSIGLQKADCPVMAPQTLHGGLQSPHSAGQRWLHRCGLVAAMPPRACDLWRRCSRVEMSRGALRQGRW